MELFFREREREKRRAVRVKVRLAMMRVLGVLLLGRKE